MRSVFVLAVVLAVAGCSDGTRAGSADTGTDARAHATESTVQTSGTVVVPRIGGLGLEYAYARLHDAGLRVTIPKTFSLCSLSGPMRVAESPRAGRRVPAGSVVTLKLAPGSLGSPAYATLDVTMRDLTGMLAGEATDWVTDQNALFVYIASIPPLIAGDAAQLLDNYRVTAQSIEPGAVIRGNDRKADRSLRLWVEPVA